MAERFYLTDKASDLKVSARLPWVRPFNRTVKPADLEGKCVHRTDTPVVGPDNPFDRAVKAVYPEVKAENRVFLAYFGRARHSVRAASGGQGTARPTTIHPHPDPLPEGEGAASVRIQFTNDRPANLIARMAVRRRPILLLFGEKAGMRESFGQTNPFQEREIPSHLRSSVSICGPFHPKQKPTTQKSIHIMAKNDFIPNPDNDYAAWYATFSAGVTARRTAPEDGCAPQTN